MSTDVSIYLSMEFI